MRVLFHGGHGIISDDEKVLIEEKLHRVSKYLEMDQADVHFHEEKNHRIADKEVCEVTMRGHGHVVRARSSNPDVLGCVDDVVAKLQHQLETLKGKLVSRKQPKKSKATPHNMGAIRNKNREDAPAAG